MGVSRDDRAKGEYLQRLASAVSDSNNFYKMDINIPDGGNLDAFGRLRVSEPVILFDSQLEYWDYFPLWFTETENGGTTTHLPNESSLQLDVTSTIGSKVIRQTKEYFRYYPGKSQLILATSVFGANTTGISKKIGYYDDLNGIYFEKDENNVLYMVTRTYTSGTVEERRYAQNDWNIDRFDGSGFSGVDIDTTKSFIFVIDIEWLGVGRVRTGFNVDGKTYYVHEFLNTNILDTVYMSTANLPVRYEIENVSSVSGCSMKQICCSVQSEGGTSDVAGCFRGSDNDGTARTAPNGTRFPLLSIRPKLTFDGKRNKGSVKPISYQVLNDSTVPLFVEVIINGTLTGASFTDLDNACIVQKDVSATAITGGIVLFSGYIGGGSGPRDSVSQQAGATSKKVLTTNFDNTDSETLTLAVTALGGNADCYGAIETLSLF